MDPPIIVAGGNTTPLPKRKELYSIAYVQAIAAVHGLQVHTHQVDFDSVDCTLRLNEGRRPSLDLQLKATSQDIIRQDHVAFRLGSKNYNDLCERRWAPAILVVLIVPERIEDWMLHDERALTMTCAAFHYDLSGLAPLEDQDSKTLEIPLANRFTADAVRDMLAHIDEHGVI